LRLFPIKLRGVHTYSKICSQTSIERNLYYMKTQSKLRKLGLLGILSVTTSLVGCSSTEQGAAYGGAGGAVIGGIVGGPTGALIGGGAGALGGAAVGAAKDNADAKRGR
jgi:hypothetical protein